MLPLCAIHTCVLNRHSAAWSSCKSSVLQEQNSVNSGECLPKLSTEDEAAKPQK